MNYSEYIYVCVCVYYILSQHKRDDKKVAVSVEESASDRMKKILNALSTTRGANILILNAICGIMFGSFMATYR